MSEYDWLASQLEEHRPHLRAVAYRMLGSLVEADDAIQDTWVRASSAGTDDVENLGGWLTTITARVCLNRLRSRTARQEDLIGQLPDPVVSRDGALQPEDEALLADSVGLALLVVLDTLKPSERLAFVLHDVFSLPFDEIAPIVDRSAEATRQLASRARRRVRSSAIPHPDNDIAQQREIVSAFYQAARNGDFAALVELMSPDVVLRSDFGTRRPPEVVRGPETVAKQSLRGAMPNATVHAALVNGAAGAVITIGDRPFAVMGFIVKNGRILEIDAMADPDRVKRISAAFLEHGDQGQS